MDENGFLEQRGGEQHRRGGVAPAADDDVGLEAAQDEKTFHRAQEDGRQGEDRPGAFEAPGQAAGRHMDELHGLAEGGHDGRLPAPARADVEEFGVGIFFFQRLVDGDIGVDMAPGAAAGKKKTIFFHLGFQRVLYRIGIEKNRVGAGKRLMQGVRIS